MGLFFRKPRDPINVELSDKNKKLRIILLCVCIAIAMGAFGIGISSLLTVESGWQEIEASSSGIHCGGDFVFNYYFDDKVGTPASEYNALRSLYSGLAADAYSLFCANDALGEKNNLGYLNQHPNEEVSVDGVLYEAFELLAESGSRALYLAPVYSVYDDLCFSEDEAYAKMKDPTRNPEVAEYFSEALSYINAPSHVELFLLGENKVRLGVSEKYAAFAEENGIAVYLDFSWLKNAFIADYLAENLERNGYTDGYLSSYDGFTRNLDDSGKTYALNVIDRVEKNAYSAASLNYSGETAMVSLRNYPLGAKDSFFYYSWSDGVITTHYIDSADGLCKSSTDNIVAYKSGGSCAEILLKLIPIYISAEFNSDAVSKLANDGIYAVWCEGTQICTTGDTSLLASLYKDENVQYKAVSK